MNKKHNKSKIVALALSIALVIVMTAMLAACNDTMGQDALKTITFDLNDGSGRTVQEVINIKEPISYTPPTREGYDFVGWSFDKAGKTAFDASAVSEESATLYAQWKIKTFGVYFFLYDGEDPISSQTVDYGKNATAPSEELIAKNLKDGDIFVKWTERFDNVKGIVYVYAETSKIHCSAIFKNGDDIIKTVEGEYGQALTLPLDSETPSKVGYTFAGWFDEDGNQAIAGETTLKDNKTYSAKWTLNAPQTPSVSGSREITYGESTTLTASVDKIIDGVSYVFEWSKSGKSLATGSEVTLEKLPAGRHVITITAYATDGTQNSKTISASLTINVAKATLTATIAPINIVYGDMLPTLDFVYSGFVSGDNSSAVEATKVVYSTEYAPLSAVGEYRISASGFTSANYDITFSDGTILVGKKTVTAKSELTFDKEYDGATLVKAFGNDSFDGILDGHTLTLNLATAASNVGEYTYKDSTIAATLKIVNADGQSVAGNYTVTFDATAIIELATINESDYTVPSAEDNTFTYDTLNHGFGVKSDHFDVKYSLAENGIYTSDAPHFADAGVYTVYYTVSHDNYMTVGGNYSVTINKAKLTVTVNNQSTVYGGDFDFDESAYSIDGNDYNKPVYTLSCAYSVGDNAGKYPIVLTIANDKNFDITANNDAVLTVGKAALSVTLTPVSVTYGEQLNLVLSDVATANGLFAGDNLADAVTLSTDYAADKDHGVNGNYYVYCALKDGNNNYVLTTEKAKVTVTERILRVQIEDMSVVYGEQLGEFVYSLTEGSLVDGDVLSNVIICESDYKCEINNYTPVGFTDINAKSGNDNYAVYAVPATVEIQKRPVTVTPSPSGIAYNLSLADWLEKTGTISIEAETQWNVSGRGFIGSDYGKGTEIDAYSFRLVRGHFGENAQEEYAPGMIGGFELVVQLNDENLEANYDVTVATVNTSVSAANYSIKINKKFAYKNGVAASFDIASAMNAGLREGDTVQGTVSTKSGEVGIYKLDWHNYTEFDDMFVINGFKVTNEYGDVTSAYSLNKVNCDISIEIAEISIPHNVQSQYEFTYDGEEHIVGVEVDDDSVEVTYSIDGGAWTSDVPSFMNVKDDLTAYTVNYKLVKYDESVAEPIEYTGSYTVKMNWRNIRVICHDQYATYGEDYTLDQTAYEFSGVLEKDKSSISVTLYVNNYKVGDCIGTYYINANTNAPRNYNCHTTAGEFHVQQKQVYVRGTQDYTVIYGEEAPEYTTYEVVDESGNIVDGAKEFIKLVNIYTPGCPAGMVYGVDTEVLLDRYFRNYKVMGCSISIEVLPCPITVKTKDASFVYGQQIALEYEIVDGTLFSGDTLDAAFDLTETHVGEYAVTPSFDSYNASNKNYAVTAQSGVVTITKATLTVALSKTQTITYGDDMPTYTATISGFVNGDDKSVLGGELIVSCDYSANKAAGTFDVTASGLTSNDYEFVYEKSSLVVKKATLTLTAKPHSAITYGDDVPTDFEYVAEDFVNGDNESILAGKVSFITQYKKGSDASGTKYTFNAACSTLDNYDVRYGEAQTLVVNKANHTKAEVDAAIAATNLVGTYKYGATLGAYPLSGTGFEWVNVNTLVTCDMNDVGYAVTYCKNKTNYNVYDGEVYLKINLEKASAEFEYDGEFGARYTGSAIDFAAIMAGTASPEGVVKANRVDLVSGWNPTFTYTLVEPVGMTQMIDGGIYKVRVSASETTNYNAAHIDVVFNVYAAQLGSTYMTVENALATAKSGDTVYLVGNAFLSKNATVNSGVTLILGLKTANYSKTAGTVTIDSDYMKTNDNPAIEGAYSWKTVAADYTLTINNTATLTISGGNIIVAGRLGHTNQPFEGHTSGSYSKIINNGNIALNGGKFDVRGLVSGSGQATFNTGSVYSPFVVRDFKGGTYTTTKAWTSPKVAPFNEYEMPNIQCNSRYCSGATLTGYADLYAGDQHNITNINAISSSGILRIASGGYIDKTYDAATEKTTLSLVGNVTLGSLQIKLSVKILFSVPITVKMSDTYFPIPWTYNINIGDGKTSSSLSVSNDYKVLPGAVITVKKGAKLNSTGNLIVYGNWTDTTSLKKYPVSKGTAGTLIVDGGTFEATAFGGIVQGTGNGGTAKVSNTLSVSAYEHDNTDRYTVSETARLADGTAMTKGETYTL